MEKKEAKEKKRKIIIKRMQEKFKKWSCEKKFKIRKAGNGVMNV